MLCSSEHGEWPSVPGRRQRASHAKPARRGAATTAHAHDARRQESRLTARTITFKLCFPTTSRPTNEFSGSHVHTQHPSLGMTGCRSNLEASRACHMVQLEGTMSEAYFLPQPIMIRLPRSEPESHLFDSLRTTIIHHSGTRTPFLEMQHSNKTGLRLPGKGQEEQAASTNGKRYGGRGR